MIKKNFHWPLLLISACLLMACRVFSSSAPTPTPRPTPVPTIPEVLAACSLDSQNAAMREDQIPTWEYLGLSACYQLELSLAPANGVYQGEAQITYQNRTSEPLSDLVFRLYPNADSLYGGRLTVTHAAVNGQTLSADSHLEDGTALRLPLTDPLRQGEIARIQLSFQGAPPEDLGGRPDVYGIFNYATGRQILTLANWYPILAVRRDGTWQTAPVIGVGDAVVSEAALYQVKITAPENWSVVATGSEINSEFSDGQRVQEFVSGPVREFIVLASPNFVETQQESDGVLIRHWGLPEGADRWGEALQVTLDSIDVFDKRFGRYPYAELEIVAVPLGGGALGVEYPGVFLIADQLYQPDDERPYLLGIVVAHETAHQWWYGVVGSDVLVYPWQDEGLTTFSSLLYLEAYQPPVYDGSLQAYRETLEFLELESGDFDLSQSAADFLDRPRLYSPVVYQKGAMFFDRLRQELGDEVFFAGLQTYYQEFRYQLAEPEDLLAVFETSCACNLDRLYDSWGATP